MPTSPITIFEIPLLLDLICESISPKDVWACRRTCRLWCNSFQPYAWHHVRLSRRIARPRAATQLLRQNAHSIRTLAVHITDTIFLATDCTRLIHLTCFGGGSSSSAASRNKSNSDRNLDHNNYLHDLQPAIATNLITQNPHLKSLAILMGYTAISQEYFPIPVLSALRQSTISTLELNLRECYDVTVLAAILIYCPDTLTELTIDNTARFEQTQFVRELAYVGGSKVSLPPWREFQSLVQLTLRHSFKFQEEAILFPLLGHSPHLRQLELPSIRMSHSDDMVTLLIESCPHIDRVLRFSEHDDLTHNRCIDILRAYPRLVEFAFCYSEDMSPEVIEVLLEQSGSTLEVLEVSAGFDTDNRERMGSCIESVLRQCPRLRSLKIVHEWEIDATGIQLQDLVRAHWASGCDVDGGGSGSLEELSMPIGSREFFRLSIADEENEDEDWDREGSSLGQDKGLDCTQVEERKGREINVECVVALARKLKACPRLRTLKLWWMNPVLSVQEVLLYLRCKEEDGDGREEIDELFLRWMGLE